MGRFFNETSRTLHKIPETKTGIGHGGFNSEMEALRRKFNEMNEPFIELPTPVELIEEPVLAVSEIEKKRARMAHAREARRVKAANRKA